MHFVTNGRFSKTNSTDPRQRVPLKIKREHKAFKLRFNSIQFSLMVLPWRQISLHTCIHIHTIINIPLQVYISHTYKKKKIIILPTSMYTKLDPTWSIRSTHRKKRTADQELRVYIVNKKRHLTVVCLVTNKGSQCKQIKV